MHWMDGWQMGWMWLVPFALIGFVIWVVVRVSGSATATPRSPEEILKDRYARGEIDRDEYQQRLTDLRK